MKIVLSRLDVEDRDASFEIFKTYLKPFIDDAFAWDEEFQRNGFETYMRPEWFSWMYLEGRRVGIICREMEESSVYVHLLVVFSDSQRKGIATAMINQLMEQASTKGFDITLSCFKNNKPALKLYEKMKFLITSEDEHSYGFTLAHKPG